MAFDRFRGLIMVLMAIDHASAFIARTHPFEDWAQSPPFYAARGGAGIALSFATRWVTHLCAPGFFMVMGAGMVWFAGARRLQGWSHGRIRRFFITRGLVLLLIQHVVENPAWLLGLVSAAPDQPPLVPPRGGGGDVILHFGVISALGAAMIVWAFLIEAPRIIVAAVSVAAVIATAAATPGPDEIATLFPVWQLLTFVPSHTGFVNVLYPVVPWLAPCGVGIILARALGRVSGPSVTVAGGGGALVAAFAVARAWGIGDPHPALPGAIGFLSVTKYPPSPAFLSLMLGVDLLLVAGFLLSARLRWLASLEAFGRAPLFFYLLHLYVFGALSFAFPRGTTFAVMYVVWAAAVLAMYPLCRWYAQFKASKPADSFWRML